MSNTMVKIGLELFEDDLRPSDGNVKKKKKKTADPMKLISTNKKGVCKELRKISQRQHQERMARKRGKKTAHEEKRQYEKSDNTEASVSFLDRLSRLDSTETSTVDKILLHSKGNLAKNKPTDSKPEQKTSIFSDRDFEKFEDEYNWWGT